MITRVCPSLLDLTIDCHQVTWTSRKGCVKTSCLLTSDLRYHKASRDMDVLRCVLLTIVSANAFVYILVL